MYLVKCSEPKLGEPVRSDVSVFVKGVGSDVVYAYGF